MKHNSLYTLTKWVVWWHFMKNSARLTEKDKFNSSVIVLSEDKQCWFTFNFFHHDWQVSSLTHILETLKQHSSQWKSVIRSTKLLNGFIKLSGYTFKQQIPKLPQKALPYSIFKSLKIDGVLLQTMRKMSQSWNSIFIH